MISLILVHTTGVKNTSDGVHLVLSIAFFNFTKKNAFLTLVVLAIITVTRPGFVGEFKKSMNF